MKRATATGARTPAPQSVERIFAVIDHLAADRGGDTLAGIARQVQAPKTSMVGLLVGMLDGGYVARGSDGVYTLGPRLLALAMRVAAKADLALIARPVLADLVAETGETALLGTLAPDASLAMYIDKVESANPVRYTVSLGERRELYSSAMGKLLLAHMPREAQARYLREERYRAFTPNTITSARRLREELDGILEDGIARTDSERVLGASALAAPVIDATGGLLVGMGLAGPSERMRHNRRKFEAALRAAAARLSALVAGGAGDLSRIS
jgi:IclR family acetate operon transcriptional repressor